MQQIEEKETGVYYTYHFLVNRNGNIYQMQGTNEVEIGHVYELLKVERKIQKEVLLEMNSNGNP